MDALVRMSGGPSLLGLQTLTGPEHSQIISIRSSPTSGVAGSGISASSRSSPHQVIAAAGTAAVSNGCCHSGVGATVYVAGPARVPEVSAPSAVLDLSGLAAKRHVVKIKIQPSSEPAAKLVSAVRLSFEDSQSDGVNDAVAEPSENEPDRPSVDSYVRINVRSSIVSQYSGSESSSEELAGGGGNGGCPPEMLSQQQEPQSCFYYSSPVSSMLISSGQCSPSETLDSGTCSDLDGTPPPLPKKKAPSTVLLECGEASVANTLMPTAFSCRTHQTQEEAEENEEEEHQQQREQQEPLDQQEQQKKQPSRHNRTGSLTSSGAEVDSSDDNASIISCDSLTGGELAQGFHITRDLELPQDEKPLVSECTYEERHRDHQNEQQQQQQSVQQQRYLYEDDCHYKFHVNEREEVGKAELAASTALNGATHNEDEYFAGYKILEREAIRSAKGTVRGVKNRVRAGIATFLENPAAKNYKAKDAGKVVVYTTTMGIVRETYYRCILVKQILRTHMVKYEERDMYMSSELQTELRDRLGCEAIEVPQLFIDGQYIGDADKVERLNETGELRLMLKPYKSLNACSTCKTCGGYRLLPCPICNGSKKSVHRNHFTTEFIALKCMNCDEVGLVRCQHC